MNSHSISNDNDNHEADRAQTGEVHEGLFHTETNETEVSPCTENKSRHILTIFFKGHNNNRCSE